MHDLNGLIANCSFMIRAEPAQAGSRFPSLLQDLIQAELAAGNSIVDLISKAPLMTRLLSVLILTAVTFAKVAAAGVELSESTITSESEKVPAGTTVTVSVVLKNTGDKSADGTDLRIRLPLNGFLVRIDELPELKRDDKEREVSARLNIPAGEECRFYFDLLASRSEVGQELASHVEVVYLWDQVRWNSEYSKRITNALPRREASSAG